MRDRRISLLLTVSFILIFASFLALGILGYHFYRKVDKAIVMQPVVNPADKIRDSLLIVYSQTISALEQKLGATFATSDSLEMNLSSNLDEYYRTRDELFALISNPRNDSDFEAAKLKIDELQYRMAALRKTNNDIEADNKKLYAVLDEIRNQTAKNNSYTSQSVSSPAPSTTKPKTTPIVAQTQQPLAPIEEDNPETTALPAPKKNTVIPKKFTAEELKLEKVVSRNNDNYTELIGSFTLFNISPDKVNSDIMIVVTKPDGKVLQKSNWESGAFTTEHGKKIYSYKMRVEQGKGEIKKLTFSLHADKNETGTFTFQIYHNGFLIGSSTQRV